VNRYLEHIRAVWNLITLQRADVRECVDIQTVEALQLRAPGVSKADREFISQAMRSGLLFPKLLNSDIRKLVKRSLLRIPCLIRSIKSMHENLKYLGTGAKIIKRLVAGKCKRYTLHRTLQDHWKEPQELLIQSAGGEIQAAVSTTLCRDLAYKQLWISVLRNFADLGGRAPRKEARGSLYEAKANPIHQYHFATFARDLGFGTKRVKACLRNDPRRQELRASMSKIRKLKPATLEKVVDDTMRRLPRDEEIAPKSRLSGDEPCKAEINDLGRRWNVPFTRMYERGQATFFLPELIKATESKDEMPSCSFIHSQRLRRGILRTNHRFSRQVTKPS
jgi:hypothetical protein